MVSYCVSSIFEAVHIWRFQPELLRVRHPHVGYSCSKAKRLNLRLYVMAQQRIV